MQGSRLWPKRVSVRVKIWRGRTCASLRLVCAAPKHSASCRAVAHCSRSQIWLITWREALSARAFNRAWFTPVSHRTCKQSRGSAEAARMQSGSSAPIVLSLAASARVRRCAQRTERSGGFGFQTKVKDRFLNQRRWTCWYSCREKMQVLWATDSLVLLFFLKSLLSLLFTSPTMEAFLIFFILLLFDSTVFAKHSVIY